MPNRAITLEALEVLDAIDRKGSFAAAANILYKVPSAITYSVQKLEQDLGVTLFTKQGRQSVLTPAGRVLLEQGRDILAATARLAETTRQIDSGWESVLNISIDTVLQTELVFPFLDEFYQIKPDIEINLYQHALGGGWEALIEDKADIAIGLPPKPSDISGLCCETYDSIHSVFAVNANHPLAVLKQPISKQDIEEYRAVVVRDSSRHHARLNHRLFSKQPVLSVQTMQDKVSAQKAGLGIGYVPRTDIEHELNNGSMVALNVEGVATDNDVYIGWRRDKKGNALKWFLNKLRKD